MCLHSGKHADTDRCTTQVRAATHAHTCVGAMSCHITRARPSTISSTICGRMWSSAYIVSGTCTCKRSRSGGGGRKRQAPR